MIKVIKVYHRSTFALGFSSQLLPIKRAVQHHTAGVERVAAATVSSHGWHTRSWVPAEVLDDFSSNRLIIRDEYRFWH